MLTPLVAIGAVTGLTLTGLLVWTIVNEKLRLWPTPGRGSWQSLLFWSLFRILNVTTLTLAFLDWKPWQEFGPERILGAGFAIGGFVLYGRACYALGRTNLYCGRDGLVTGGIYSWTRNPQYATAIPAYLGLAIASYSPFAFALASLLALSFALMAFAEERWLEVAYGEDYRRYRRKVARFYNWRHAIWSLGQEVSRVREPTKQAKL